MRLFAGTIELTETKEFTMKKSAFTTVLILFIAGLVCTVHGQGKLEEFMNETTPEERAQMQTDHMKESLALTEDQVPKVGEINLKYSHKMQDAYNTPGSKLQKLRKFKSISTEKDKEMKNVLKPEQYSTYETNKAEMKEKIRARAKERRKG